MFGFWYFKNSLISSFAMESHSKNSFSRSRCVGSEPGIREKIGKIDKQIEASIFWFFLRFVFRNFRDLDTKIYEFWPRIRFLRQKSSPEPAGKLANLSWGSKSDQIHFSISVFFIRSLSGNFRDISGKFPGNFREISGKFPGNFREISGKFPGNFREISGKNLLIVVKIAWKN